MLTLLLALSSAHAAPKAPAAPPAPCKAQSDALAAASPGGSGKAFADLAACDAALAKAAAPTAFGAMLAGPGGDAAMVAGLQLGLGETVRGWVQKLEPGERAAAIDTLGKSCGQPGVAAFWPETATALGEAFWTAGWFKGLDECRDPAARTLLVAAAEAPVKDRTRYSSVLEAAARNLGKEALPLLEKLLATHKADAELATYVVRAFGDAAGIGGVGGMDKATALQAIKGVNDAAPNLPALTLDQARQTLGALGADEQLTDQLSRHRYRDVLQGDGKLRYGVFVTEVATCKKGDTKVEAHQATAHLVAWPDQVDERVKAATIAADSGIWKVDLAERCKGTSVKTVKTSEAPLKDQAAVDAWLADQAKELLQAQPSFKKARDQKPLDL